jgi:sulfur carrier protein
MQIVINSESREVPEDTSVEQLLEVLELMGQRLAVEVNLEIVPRSEYAAHMLHPDDRIEIVRAIGGG